MTHDPSDQIAAYLEGRLDAEEVAELEAWLREDPERRKAFARQAMLDCHLVDLLREESVASLTADLSDDSQFGALLQALDAPNNTVELVDITGRLRIEEQANRALELDQRRRNRPGTAEPASRQPLFLYRALAYGGLAAVLLIAIALLWPTAQTPGPEPIAEQPPTELAKPTVALLSATHDAVWASPQPGDRASASTTLAPGDPLRAGDRLKLTAGFAEITTMRGAVAIIQAPASIELTHSDNAIQLHAGRLVGICQTPSAKGFVVRTPHLDVTDIGTRFGVDVTDPRATEVAVFQGEIEVALLDNDQRPAQADPQRLELNQAVRSDTANNKLVLIEHDTSTFAKLLPTRIALPGTGQGLAKEQPDPRWVVLDASGQAQAKGTPMFVSLSQPQSSGQAGAGDSQAAQMLQYYPTQQPTDERPVVVHRIQTTFELDPTLSPESSQLVIRFAVDDVLTAVHVNGQRIPVSHSRFLTPTELVIQRHLKAGQNTIAFEVQNRRMDSPNNAIGLYVDWYLMPMQAGLEQSRATGSDG